MALRNQGHMTAPANLRAPGRVDRRNGCERRQVGQAVGDRPCQLVGADVKHCAHKGLCRQGVCKGLQSACQLV